MYNIGSSMPNIVLPTYNGEGYNNTAQFDLLDKYTNDPDFQNRVFLISFINVQRECNWLTNIKTLKNNPYFPGKYRMIIALFRHDGTNFTSIASDDASDAVTNAGLTDNDFADIPILLDTNGIISSGFLNGIINSGQPGYDPGYGTTYTEYKMWAYITTNDLKISDKWHTECKSSTNPSNNDPISFNMFGSNTVFINPTGSFTAGQKVTLDLSAITPLVGKKIVTFNDNPQSYNPDFSGPRIKSVIPADGSSISGNVSIVITFTDPLTDGNNYLNYRLSGPGANSVTINSDDVHYQEFNGFDSKDFNNTEFFVLQRLIYLCSNPAILYAVPENHMVLRELPVDNSTAHVDIVFSKPVISGSSDPDSSNFSLTGGGWGTHTIDTVVYSGKEKYENRVVVEFTDGALSDNPDSSMKITVLNIEDSNKPSPIALSGSNEIKYTADVTAPVAELSDVPENPTNDNALDVTVGGEGVTSYKYKLNNNPWSNEIPISTHIKASGLTDGTHTLKVCAKDAAGNWQTEVDATSHSWTVDTQAPIAQLSNLPENPTCKANIQVTVGGNEVEAYLYRLDDSEWSDELSITQPITASNLAPGNHILKVVGRDAAGNWQSQTSPTSHSWTIKSIIPHEVVFVLDLSGSMGRRAPLSGGQLSPHPKIWYLRNTVTRIIQNWYDQTLEDDCYLEDKVGFTCFKSHAFTRNYLPVDQSLVRISDNWTGGENLELFIQTLGASGCTAMGAALTFAMGMLDYTSPDPSRKRRIILVTDGMQNRNPLVYKQGSSIMINTIGQSQFPEGLSNLCSQSDNNGASSKYWGMPPWAIFDSNNPQNNVPIYTIGIGDTAPWQTMLEEISNSTGGTHYQDTESWWNGDETFDQLFQEIFADNSPQIVTSGSGILTEGMTSSEQKFIINRSAKRATINLCWPSTIKLIFTIKKGNTMISNFLNKTEGINYRVATISFSGVNPEGEWVMEIKRRSLNRIDQPIPYYFSVFVEETVLDLHVLNLKKTLFTGQSFQIGIKILQNKRPVDAIHSAVATVERPEFPVEKLLPKFDKTFSSQKIKKRPDIYPEEMKIDMLYQNPESLKMLTRKVKLKLKLQPGRVNNKKFIAKKKWFHKPGLLQAVFKDASIPGIYRIKYEITGEGKECGKFMRTIVRKAVVHPPSDKKISDTPSH